MLRRIALVVILTGILVAQSALPALAVVTVTTTGAEASYYDSPNYMYVYDTSADGYSVYAEYCWGTSCSSGTKVYNSNGDGTVVRHTLSPVGSFITFRVCRDKPLQPDNCSSWVTGDA